MSVIGLRVGPYEILEAAEVPETGSWYLARRTAYNRKQPSEILVRLTDHDAEEGQRAALQHYFERLRKLEDARIPAAVGYFEGHGAVAIQCVRGVSLSSLLELIQTNEIDLTQATALDIVIDLCEAINHAHNRGVIHGALSLDSLVLGESGQLWIFGFGTGPNEVCESTWIPPERVSGDAATARTDQWSIAAIANALVSGEVPWHEKRPPSASDTSTIGNQLAREWSSLARIIKPMLESNPAHRYDSLQQARQELLALNRQQARPADRRELARKLHLYFSTPLTYEGEGVHRPSQSTITSLDTGLKPIDMETIEKGSLDMGSLIDSAVELVAEELLAGLEGTFDDMTPDEDPPSAPGTLYPFLDLEESDESEATDPEQPSSPDLGGTGEFFSADMASDTAVPESDPSSFDLGDMQNIKFTNPESPGINLGELATIEPNGPEDTYNEPSLPTMEFDLSFDDNSIPPREKSLVVQLAPWIAAAAMLGMVAYLFLG